MVSRDPVTLSKCKGRLGYRNVFFVGFYHYAIFIIPAPDKLTVADKLSKQVDETYVQKDGDDEEEERKKTVGGSKKKRKEKKFVPAAKWALVYRALKPLLRPCGDLGEGRLDFYHRSISKAVRRK